MTVNRLTSRGILADLTQALSQGDGALVTAMARKFTSDQGSEEYAWLGQSPAMREWLGGRSAKDLREFSFSVANKEYEASIQVTVPELRRAKTDAIQIRINDLATRVNAHPYRLITNLIVAGESNVCYDGQFFFDTDHAEFDSGTQDNDLTYAAATGTTPTVDEMRGAIIQAAQKMYGFKDDRGEPINENVRQFGVMVPMIYWAQAVEAVNLATVANGGQNLLQNMPNCSFTVIPNVRLDAAGWTTKFATFAMDGDV
jgi:hypothetical protein